MIQAGFKQEGEERKMSAFNAIMSYNKKNALEFFYPDIKTDYSKILIANGKLPLPENYSVETEGNKLWFTWNTRLAKECADNDQTILLAYILKWKLHLAFPVGQGENREKALWIFPDFHPAVYHRNLYGFHQR